MSEPAWVECRECGAETLNDNGLCRECDLSELVARSSCRSCGRWIICTPHAATPAREQHEPGCALTDAGEWTPRTPDEIDEVMRMRGYR